MSELTVIYIDATGAPAASILAKRAAQIAASAAEDAADRAEAAAGIVGIAPTIAAPTITLDSQDGLTATFLIEWSTPGGGAVTTRTRTVSDGTTTETMTADGEVTFDKAAAQGTVTATDSVEGPAGTDSATESAALPALAAGPSLSGPQKLTLSVSDGIGSLELDQFRTGGIAPFVYSIVGSPSHDITIVGTDLTAAAAEAYDETVTVRVTDAAGSTDDVAVLVRAVSTAAPPAGAYALWDPAADLSLTGHLDATGNGNHLVVEGSGTVLTTSVSGLAALRFAGTSKMRCSSVTGVPASGAYSIYYVGSFREGDDNLSAGLLVGHPAAGRMIGPTVRERRVQATVWGNDVRSGWHAVIDSPMVLSMHYDGEGGVAVYIDDDLIATETRAVDVDPQQIVVAGTPGANPVSTSTPMLWSGGAVCALHDAIERAAAVAYLKTLGIGAGAYAALVQNLPLAVAIAELDTPYRIDGTWSGGVKATRLVPPETMPAGYSYDDLRIERTAAGEDIAIDFTLEDLSALDPVAHEIAFTGPVVWTATIAPDYDVPFADETIGDVLTEDALEVSNYTSSAAATASATLYATLNGSPLSPNATGTVLSAADVLAGYIRVVDENGNSRDYTLTSRTVTAGPAPAIAAGTTQRISPLAPTVDVADLIVGEYDSFLATGAKVVDVTGTVVTLETDPLGTFSFTLAATNNGATTEGEINFVAGANVHFSVADQRLSYPPGGDLQTETTGARTGDTGANAEPASMLAAPQPLSPLQLSQDTPIEDGDVIGMDREFMTDASAPTIEHSYDWRSISPDASLATTPTFEVPEADGSGLRAVLTTIQRNAAGVQVGAAVESPLVLRSSWSANRVKINTGFLLASGTTLLAGAKEAMIVTHARASTSGNTERLINVPSGQATDWIDLTAANNLRTGFGDGGSADVIYSSLPTDEDFLCILLMTPTKRQAIIKVGDAAATLPLNNTVAADPVLNFSDIALFDRVTGGQPFTGQHIATSLFGWTDTGHLPAISAIGDAAGLIAQCADGSGNPVSPYASSGLFETYDTPLIDFRGDAAALAAGTHDGAWEGSFAPQGTIDFEDV